MSGPMQEWEHPCIRTMLTEQEREDNRVAVETVFEATTGQRTMDEWIELVLAEADAIARRRALSLIHTCPHCGGAVPCRAAGESS